ncbi:C-type lectin domain-containing protein [Caenorhabditis elegans]|uniref:C-type lectin domain-containing protein n=1 Tax=Caenorhabditis elegans TaxID=6239 RepID=Q7YWS2_CAEEL|nr:C-type lectin domain-containing protein [Caenorhabditis elegans]CAE17978.2 C-type lectin domain-containing protein [Caenorhabditis elegans]
MTFERPQGRWCAKVFFGGKSWDAAEAQCKSLGATLTGLQNNNERLQIATTARALTNQNGGGFSEVWLGARRRARCPVRSSCSDLDAFEWLDGHTTGTDGMHWGGPGPDGWVNPPYGVQSCMGMYIHPWSDTAQASVRSFIHADLDDLHCYWPMNYACGKLPT